MTGAYEPSCKLCRENAKSYYMSCQGCQARRQKHVGQWLKKPGFPPYPKASEGKS